MCSTSCPVYSLPYELNWNFLFQNPNLIDFSSASSTAIAKNKFTSIPIGFRIAQSTWLYYCICGSVSYLQHPTRIFARILVSPIVLLSKPISMSFVLFTCNLCQNIFANAFNTLIRTVFTSRGDSDDQEKSMWIPKKTRPSESFDDLIRPLVQSNVHQNWISKYKTDLPIKIIIIVICIA